MQTFQEGNGTNDKTVDDKESIQQPRSTSTQNRRSGTPARSRSQINNESQSRDIVEWSGFQFQQQQSGTLLHRLKDVIVLDTGSTLKATFMNPELVTDIRVAPQTVSMATNTGCKTMDLEAAIPGFGLTWFNPNQIANIYGFSHMVDLHRITYDLDREDAFLVHSSNGIVKFARTPDGLYVYKPTTKFKGQVAKLKEMASPISVGGTQVSNMVSTVK
jgi:hypothetical protein